MFDGVDLLHCTAAQSRSIRGKRVAMIFQDPMTSLNPVLTIGRQIRESLETHFDMGRRDAEKRAAELLDRRAAARAAKDWAESDSLRDQLLALGVVVADTAEGQEWSLG